MIVDDPVSESKESWGLFEAVRGRQEPNKEKDKIIMDAD